MKLSLLLLILISYSVWSAEEFKSLSCSRRDRGTQIFFINGVFNEEFGPDSAEATAENILGMILERGKTRFDSNGNVFVENIYNTSEPFLLDLIQTIIQKMEETEQTPSARGIGQFLFKRAKYCILNPLVCGGITAGVGRLLAVQSYISNSDLSLMASMVSQHLHSDYKVIVISHSQGNLYSNMLYERLISYGVEKELLDNFYGNFQIASPASKVLSKNFKLFSSNQDSVINSLRVGFPTILKSNYYLASSDDKDKLKHTMALTYLSPSVFFFGPKQGKDDFQNRSAQQIFVDGLEELSWKLANNDSSCCFGRDGRFYRANYDEPTQDGFVESTVSISKKTNLKTIGSTQLCGNLFLGKKDEESFLKFEDSTVFSDRLSYISGNVSMFDSNFHFLNHLESAEIKGHLTEEIPLYFERVNISGNPKVSGAMIFSDVNLYGSSNISGAAFEVTSEENYFHIPYLANTTINGGVLQGVYTIDGRDLFNSTIKGEGLNASGGVFKLTHILPEPRPNRLLVESHVEGIVYLGGGVDSYNTIVGKVIGTNETGVYFPSGTILENSSVLGSIIITNGSTFSGHFNCDVLRPGTGHSGELQNSHVINTSIDGAPFIQNSSITEGNISNHPDVKGSTLFKPTIYGNASIQGENTSNMSYGWGYSTPTHFKEPLDSDQFLEQKETVKNMIEELTLKQNDIRSDWNSAFQ